jgi:hypothetical protein
MSKAKSSDDSTTKPKRGKRRSKAAAESKLPKAAVYEPSGLRVEVAQRPTIPRTYVLKKVQYQVRSNIYHRLRARLGQRKKHNRYRLKYVREKRARVPYFEPDATTWQKTEKVLGSGYIVPLWFRLILIVWFCLPMALNYPWVAPDSRFCSKDAVTELELELQAERKLRMFSLPSSKSDLPIQTLSDCFITSQNPSSDDGASYLRLSQLPHSHLFYGETMQIDAVGHTAVLPPPRRPDDTNQGPSAKQKVVDKGKEAQSSQIIVPEACSEDRQTCLPQFPALLTDQYPPKSQFSDSARALDQGTDDKRMARPTPPTVIQEGNMQANMAKDAVDDHQ